MLRPIQASVITCAVSMLLGCGSSSSDEGYGCPAVVSPALEIAVYDAATEQGLLCQSVITLAHPGGEITEYAFADDPECELKNESMQYYAFEGMAGLYDVRVEAAGYHEENLQDIEVKVEEVCGGNLTERLDILLEPKGQ